MINIDEETLRNDAIIMLKDFGVSETVVELERIPTETLLDMVRIEALSYIQNAAKP